MCRKYGHGIVRIFPRDLLSTANYAVAVSNFRPFEGVGGPIGPIFWPQVIWSLAPMALMQKKTGQIDLDWSLRSENWPKVSIDSRC